MGITYLDHAATTPVRPDALQAMLPFFSERFANPSGSHRFARDARKALDEARDNVARVLGVEPGEVVFTGCGSESNNTVVAGVAGTAVCSAAEHHAVLHPIEERGGVVVGVDASGHIRLDELEAVLNPAVGLVSVMAVNNEVGTISDLAAVARVVRKQSPGALLHTDAVQAPSWLDLRAISPLVDLMSFSAHKFGGPKGVGVLTIRRGVRVAPLISGGGQERERRSGTHNVAGVVAMAEALDATDRDRDVELVRIAALRDRLVDELVGAFDGITETVDRSAKVAGSAHLCIEGIESESLLFLLDEADVCASAASACASGAMEPSHVLAAMGVHRSRSGGALRLSLGHTTTASDVDRALDVITAAVAQLRKMPVSR
ncbi:MAG TPA: cysteine desulfurase family protein [Ilumatobacter sp.]|nr:cysteine desulfurase family protein [Ilumatobacter sp.]